MSSFHQPPPPLIGGMSAQRADQQIANAPGLSPGLFGQASQGYIQNDPRFNNVAPESSQPGYGAPLGQQPPALLPGGTPGAPSTPATGNERFFPQGGPVLPWNPTGRSLPTPALTARTAVDALGRAAPGLDTYKALLGQLQNRPGGSKFQGPVKPSDMHRPDKLSRPLQGAWLGERNRAEAADQGLPKDLYQVRRFRKGTGLGASRTPSSMLRSPAEVTKMYGQQAGQRVAADYRR